MAGAVTPVIPLLEGTVARKSLQFFWLTDCSGSMSGKKIATLNQAIREALPEIRNAVGGHPEVQVLKKGLKLQPLPKKVGRDDRLVRWTPCDSRLKVEQEMERACEVARWRRSNTKWRATQVAS